jgi:glycosyltransferase involved in cell wall biosynthesis
LQPGEQIPNPPDAKPIESKPRLNWIVSQIGARQHYGVPRGFLETSNLRLLYTEAWCRRGQSFLAGGSRHMRAFAGRYHPAIPGDRVKSFNRHFLFTQLLRRSRNAGTEQKAVEYLHDGRWFASAVAADLSRQTLDPDRDLFFGFNTGCLETLMLMKQRGITSICDQIDPASVEEQMVHQESLKWPGWEKSPGRVPDLYWQRMRDEWAAADLVLVNSKWSMNALLQQGVPAAKLFVVPVAYEARPGNPPVRNTFTQPLTVLWLGSVNLRKGIQYLIEAARHLGGNPRIRFVVAGPISIAEAIVASAPKNMEFLGQVTRDRTEQIYRSADLFVLPTISDGFAITQVEAMAQGLPVITTPNCGEVVTSGVDGLIVPPFDGAALAEAIIKLDADRNLLREMSSQAIKKSLQFSLARQTAMIEAAVTVFRKGAALNESLLPV